MLRASLAKALRRPAASRLLPAVQSRGFISSAEDYGSHLFTGAVADAYLAKQGLPAGLLDDPSWTKTSSDKVAAAVMEWAHDKGASVFTHWFQPMGAAGVRMGMSGQVHNAMFVFGKDGKPEWELDGKTLLKGETDGSSYPSGGMRATHTAGGYTILDPTSPIFIKGDTVYAPTVFVSFYGDALDEKTPLLRAMKAVDDETTRLLKLLGYSVGGVQPNIGLEQEYFLVPRSAFYKRMDLQLTGRTIMGKNAPRGQEMCDHYMGPPNQIAMACIQEIQHECFMMGISMRTRHREVAPNQYENAPFFGTATTQIDQNLMFMQIAEEVSARHGLACLMHEKPFAGINGSGKHNNISLGTTEARRACPAPSARTLRGTHVNLPPALPSPTGRQPSQCRAAAEGVRVVRDLPGPDGRYHFRGRHPWRPDAHGDRLAGQRLPSRRVRGAAGYCLDLPRRRHHRVPRKVHGGRCLPLRAEHEDRRPRHPEHRAVHSARRGSQPHVALPVRRAPLRVPRGGLVAERLARQRRPLHYLGGGFQEHL